MKLNEIVEVFDLLKNTSSRNEKEAIVAKNKDDELFKECLVFLLDSQVMTGISGKKWNKIHVTSSKWTHKENEFEFVQLLDYIKHNNTGRDEDIIHCKSWCYGLSKEVIEFTEGMVTKSIKLGIDTKTVNKVIPGLIKVHNVMLGTPLEKANLKNEEWISLSHKLNGVRCSWVGNKLMSRQGKEFTGLEHIINDIKRIYKRPENIFLDGELLYKNTDGKMSDSEAFQYGTGLAAKKDADKSELKLVIFDIMDLNEFYDGKSKDTYRSRYKTLRNLEDCILELGLENINVVETVYQGKDHSQIWKWLDYAEDMGWEGLCLNTDSIYECKRTKNLLKVKKFFTIDLRCTSVNIATTGKYKGLMGSITCKYCDGAVDVGSGFSEHDRKLYSEHPEYMVGKIIEIKYKEMTQNKDGGKSLQFPVFQCIRDECDKNIADDE